MALRRKKGSTSGNEVKPLEETASKITKTPAQKAASTVKKAVTNATKKATTSTKKPTTKKAAPVAKPKAPKELVEELQNVGADVVPSGTISSDDVPEAAAQPPGFVSQPQGVHEPEWEPEAPPPPVAGEPSRAHGEPSAVEHEPAEVAGDVSAGEGAHEPAGERPALLAQDDQPNDDGTDNGQGTTDNDDIVDPRAIREHTHDQIAPEARAPETGARDASTPETLLTDGDIHLFNEGTHHRLWEKLGAHMTQQDGVHGTNFAVWAPNAASVSVIGDFNEWNKEANRLQLRGSSGIWEGFVPYVGKGTVYKYHIVSSHGGYKVDKADPFGIYHQIPPETASVVWDLDYEWNDDEWMRNRAERNAFAAPMTIYEVHLGSWRRVADDGQTGRSMTYREIAQPLAEYVKKLNFTHVELLPVMEHPFFGSWGYQCTGFFAPTSRFGTPQDFKYLVDVLHQHGIGVILDWVPSHFPTDAHGLSYFDGTHLFEHADPRKGFQPDWGSLVFNYGRNEVRAFLISSAIYWLGEYHADGLRVDAVASMLYLDYSRKAGEWIPNEFGGRENIEAIAFLRRLNEDVYKVHPDVQVIAEESTAWPMVSRPTYVGGLGFGMKWDMGWMHDTLRYFSKDPIHRRYHHNDLTFRMMYAFTENFVLPLSHDEVVHGKGSLLGKMPGDDWRRFANLRLLFAHMYANPGKKLLFMGGELGTPREWNHDGSLDWHLLEHPLHAGLNRWVEDLNKAYRDLPALHELDISPDGFEWIDCCDSENSVVALMRRAKSNPDEVVVVVLNFTPLPRQNYQVGVPFGGHWKEALNTDAELYGGSGQGNMGGVDAAPIPLHGRRWSVNLTLPPLGAVFLTAQRSGVDVAAGDDE
ncbi:MAG TPA: 1,4-alpha-glucan branching protein GlgB [Thermoanaerobaculia bacterium]